MDFGSFQVITPTNAVRRAINEAVRLKMRQGQRKVKSHYRSGDRIIFLRNDKDAAVYNGLSGIVVDVHERRRQKDNEIEVLLNVPDKERPLRTFTEEFLRANVDFAWCISVHKAQGSEWDEVVVILPWSAQYSTTFYSRRLLYTALSRAKLRLSVMGPPALLEMIRDEDRTFDDPNRFSLADYSLTHGVGLALDDDVNLVM